jgi:hypothetical protein
MIAAPKPDCAAGASSFWEEGSSSSAAALVRAVAQNRKARDRRSRIRPEVETAFRVFLCAAVFHTWRFFIIVEYTIPGIIITYCSDCKL